MLSRNSSSRPSRQEARRSLWGRFALAALATALALVLSLDAGVFRPATTVAQEPPPRGSDATVTPAPPVPPDPNKPTPAPPGVSPQVAPPNDNFAAAFVAGMLPYNDTQVTTDATLEAGEPQPCGGIGKTVWYSFTPTVTGTYQVGTSGSSFDTVIAVYTGATLATLTNVGGCNDDFFPGFLSMRQFQGVAGTPYSIQVGGFSGGFGTLVFSLTRAGLVSCSSNDGFELGVPNTNVIPCWTVVPAGGAPGSWCTQTGGAPPVGVTCPGAPYGPVPPPPAGAQAAMTNEAAPNAQALYRCGVVSSGSIAFLRALNNWFPAGVPWVPGPLVVGTQQFRADVVFATGIWANPFTIGGADVFLNMYQTLPLDPPFAPYAPVGGAAPVGANVCLRFADVATTGPLSDGVDSVSFDVCRPPWDWSVGDCYGTDGMWHWESSAQIAGMSNKGVLAFNQGCVDPLAISVAGCNYATGAAVSGQALSPVIGLAGAKTLSFKTARQTEYGGVCGTVFDLTTVLDSTDNGATFGPLDLSAGSITAGTQQIAPGTGGTICADSLTAQTVTVPLPAAATNVGFRFDSTDGFFNGFAGQFIDDVTVTCTAGDPDADQVCSDVDNCPTTFNPNQANNDASPFVSGGQPWMADGLGDACDPDDDNDGCIDTKETGANHLTGGERDPLVPWDFFDVPAPAGPAVGGDGKLILTPASVRNKAVTLQDVGVVLAYVGRLAANPAYIADNNLDGWPDGPELDRTPSANPLQPWRSGPPNGSITLQDVGVALAQVGNICT